MNDAFILPALFAQGLLITGQILLKRALSATRPWRVFIPRFAVAIGFQALYFFIWMALAGRIPLTKLAPFDALGPVMLVMAVHLVLRESLDGRAWIGVGLVLAGISIIALS